MAKVILVEDDSAEAAMVLAVLEREGLSVDVCDDGNDGCKMLEGGQYDLAILDWQLPGMSGVEICDSARKSGLTLPILMLTSRNQSRDKATGLDLGADDYLTKPFDPRELLARVRALLRRPQTLSSNELRCGSICLHLESSQVLKDDRIVELMPAEYALLEFLLRNQGKAFSAEELLASVWKADAHVTLSAVTTCIKRLRDKIDSDERQSILKTVHGIGYMIEA